MNGTVFPIWLALAQDGYFPNPEFDPITGPNGEYNRLLDPAPSDFLVDGVTEFTDLSQVDQTKLTNYLYSKVAGHHAGGTCKMGVKGDPTAVVDQKRSGIRPQGIAHMRHEHHPCECLVAQWRDVRCW